jgi:hypothetical protein
MKLPRILQWARSTNEDRGSATVEMAVIIGVVLLVAAVLLGPHLIQLVQSLMSKWQIQ